MCRAVWVVIVARDEDAAKRLRRAAGIECQVVAMATSVADAGSILSDQTVDCVVLDAQTAAAHDEIVAIRARAPHAAIVWIGDESPADVEQSVQWSDEISDALPGAITKALLARKRTAG